MVWLLNAQYQKWHWMLFKRCTMNQKSESTAMNDRTSGLRNLTRTNAVILDCERCYISQNFLDPFKASRQWNAAVNSEKQDSIKSCSPTPSQGLPKVRRGKFLIFYSVGLMQLFFNTELQSCSFRAKSVLFWPRKQVCRLSGDLVGGNGPS